MGVAQRTLAACVMTRERGMMVATGRGLYVCLGVCGETTKIKEDGCNIFVNQLQILQLSTTANFKCINWWFWCSIILISINLPNCHHRTHDSAV